MVPSSGSLDLLLVLAQNRDGLGVLQHVLHLRGREIGVEAHDLGADAESGVLAPEQLRLVLADDRDRLPALHAQRREPHGDIAHAGNDVVPGVALPDAVVLAPVQHAALVARGLVQQQLRDRLHAGGKQLVVLGPDACDPGIGRHACSSPR
jgi:hypothetical protein